MNVRFKVSYGYRLSELSLAKIRITIALGVHKRPRLWIV